MNNKLLVILLIVSIAGVTGTWYYQTKMKPSQAQTQTAPAVGQNAPEQSASPPPEQFRDPYKDMTVPQDDKK